VSGDRHCERVLESEKSYDWLVKRITTGSDFSAQSLLCYIDLDAGDRPMQFGDLGTQRDQDSKQS